MPAHSGSSRSDRGRRRFAASAAADLAGNTGAAATHTWRVETAEPTDTTAPDTTIGQRPSDPSNDPDPSIAFSGTDDMSAASALTFECRLDSPDETGWGSCTSPKENIGLDPGSHTFEARAVDEAGNRDPSPDSYTWIVDTAAPDTHIGSGPDAPTQSPDASFTFSGSDDTTATSALRFECALDDVAFALCSSPVSYTNLADGQHLFRVRAVDRAGNTDPDAASRAWVIDRGAPDTTIGDRPSNPTNQTSATFSFSGTDSESQPSAIRFECRLDIATFASCTSPRVYSGLSASSHTFDVRAIDSAGNVDGAPARYTWIVDTSAPNTTLSSGSGPSGTVTSRDATFAFSSTEAGSSFQCSLDSTAAYAACTSPHSYSNLPLGSHTFRVRAIDPAGNVDGTPAVRTWTIQADTTAPSTTINDGPSGTVTSTTATFTFSSNETGSTFECALDGPTFSSCASPREYTGLSAGPHTFQVRARDGAGNLDQSPASRTWTIEIVGPCGRAVTLTATADAWIEQNSPSSNRGTDSILKVKSQGPTDNFRALVQFAIPTDVPAGCVIESATLRLYAASATTGRTLEARSLATAWTENGVTWGNQPLTNGTAVTTSSGSGYREWVVTSQVQAMNEAGTSHGFLIRDVVEGSSGMEQSFHAREKGESPPQLVIRYAPEPSAGVEGSRLALARVASGPARLNPFI